MYVDINMWIYIYIYICIYLFMQHTRGGRGRSAAH